MSDKLKFNCACGKTLSADPKLAGKKAKCPNCAQIVVIPSPKPAVAPRAEVPTKKPPIVSVAKRTITPPASAAIQPVHKHESPPAAQPASSVFDEESEYELEHPSAASCAVCGKALPPGAATCPQCGDALPSGQQLSSASASPKRSRPAWLYFAAFGIYILLVWLVSLFAPMGSILLVMPLIAVGMLAFMFGGLWYLAVLGRDNPGEASVLIFGILLSFVGLRASAVGYATGKIRGRRAANPAHARPIAVLKFGALCLAFSMGAALIVGIAWGAWRKDAFHKADFPSPPPLNRGNFQPPQPRPPFPQHQPNRPF